MYKAEQKQNGLLQYETEELMFQITSLKLTQQTNTNRNINQQEFQEQSTLI